MKPTVYERDLLRHLNGEQVEGLRWGAAMSEAIESLLGAGLVSLSERSGAIRYDITESGRRAIQLAEQEG